MTRKGFWEEALLAAMQRQKVPLSNMTRELRLNGDSPWETVPDFAWPAIKAAVYLDEVYWHAGGEAMDRDRLKRNRLQIDGWVVVAFTDRQVQLRPDWCAQEVIQTLISRRASIVKQIALHDDLAKGLRSHARTMRKNAKLLRLVATMFPYLIDEGRDLLWNLTIAEISES